MSYLVRLVTPPGGKVLDPFVGSGSTIVAALEEGMSGVGIEKDPKNHKIATLRVNAFLDSLKVDQENKNALASFEED